MRWWILVIFVSVAVLFFASCSDDPEKPDPEPVQMQAGSWEEAVDLFAAAWEEKNFELYDSLLTDDFVFYFSPVDVVENPDIPPSWNRAQDVGAVEALFNDPNVEDIVLSWVPGDLLNAETEGLEGRVLVANIDLVIDSRDAEGVLWNNGIRGEVEFEFEKMSYTTSEGDTVWKVARWKDLTFVPILASQGRTTNTTWGSIKNIYRGPEPDQPQAGSWEEAVDLFAAAWEEKNFALYDSLLTEDFVFYFADVDVEENPDIPPSWNRTQEVRAVKALFRDPNVEGVDLTWVPGDFLDAETEGLDGRALVTNIDLTIQIRDDENVLWHYEISGDVEFEFMKMSYTTSEGDTVWKVATWRDQTFTPILASRGIIPVASATWGLLKSLY